MRAEESALSNTLDSSLRVVVAVVPSGSLPDAGMVGWALISLFVPACFAGLNVFTELYHPPETPPFALSAGVLLAGAAMLLPLTV